MLHIQIKITVYLRNTINGQWIRPSNVNVLEIDQFVPVFTMVHETRGIVNGRGTQLIELKYNKMQ